MYSFPGNLTDVIASLLTEADKNMIRVAITTLENKPSGDRMQIIVNRYFGIECEQVTLKEIGASLSNPISGSSVRQLRSKAERYLRKIPELRPLVERITKAGIEGRWTDQTLSLPSLTQLEALRSAVNEPEVSKQRFMGLFLHDCFPTCVPEDSCPTCRAREVLQPHGLLPEITRLAQEWQSGPSDDWRSISVDTVDFSIRTKNCLRNMDVRTLGQLCAQSAAELMRGPYFGRKSMNEVLEFLSSIGQRLRS